MKKNVFKSILSSIIILPIILFCGCTNMRSDVANSIDNNITRFVYSINYIDLIDTNNYSFLSTTNNITSTDGIDNKNIDNSNNVQTATTQAINSATANSTITAYGRGDARSSVLGGLMNNGRTLFGGTNLISNISNGSVSNASTNMANNYVLNDTTKIMNDRTMINDYIDKVTNLRSKLMLYSNDIRNGSITLTNSEKNAINEYIATIRESTNYINSNSSQLSRHLNNINNIKNFDESTALVNAKLLRIENIIATRYLRIDEAVSAMDGILQILRNHGLRNYDSTNNLSMNQTDNLNNTNDLNNIDNTSINNTAQLNNINNDNCDLNNNILDDSLQKNNVHNPQNLNDINVINNNDNNITNLRENLDNNTNAIENNIITDNYDYDTKKIKIVGEMEIKDNNANLNVNSTNLGNNSLNNYNNLNNLQNLNNVNSVERELNSTPIASNSQSYISKLKITDNNSKKNILYNLFSNKFISNIFPKDKNPSIELV